MTHDMARYAEHLVEMAEEATTKKEAAQYWKEYRNVMIRMTGDKNLFRRKVCHTNKPSKALLRTVRKCVCKSNCIIWSRHVFSANICPLCNKSSGYGTEWDSSGKMVRHCHSCGKDYTYEHTDDMVMFACKCGKQTKYHKTNAAARDEWNSLQEKLK